MKYLDERITQQINLGDVQSAGLYKYEIQVYNVYTNEWDVVFVGNYYNGGVRYYTFDITDICRSRKYNYHTSFSNRFEQDIRLIDIYRIVVSTVSGTDVVGDTIEVAYIYRYPNRQGYSNTYLHPYYSFFDHVSSTRRDVSVLLQGSSRLNGEINLIPRYPIVNDPQDLDYDNTMTFGLTIEVGTDQQYVTLFSVESGEDPADESLWLGEYELDHLNFYNYTHTFFNGYNRFVFSQGGDIPLSSDIDVYIRWKDVSNVYQYRRIAVIEACKSRYYLLWQDRFGSYQAQPFKGKLEYSENIKNTEFTNYYDKRFKSGSAVQPKWRINSGWLKEEVFPYYESIFVSPVLRLFDTATQAEYDVIVDDNYIEKKYENNKQLLSIELELEATEKQNITY